MDERARQGLGQPDLKLAGFALWIHGRQFPGVADYWDGNWLTVTAHCGAKGAEVWATGSVIHLPEIRAWIIGTQILCDTLSGTAGLDCMEEQLRVALKAETRGHISMTVEITPDHLTQQHRFEFDIDQSDLPAFLAQGWKFLAQFPLKGAEAEGMPI